MKQVTIKRHPNTVVRSAWWDIPRYEFELCDCGLQEFFKYPKELMAAHMCFTKHPHDEAYRIELVPDGYITLDGEQVFLLDYAYALVRDQVKQGYKYVRMEYSS